MAINVGTAIAYLDLDMSSFKSSLASAGAELKTFATGGGIQSLGNVMSGVGSELTTKVTLPIVGAGAASAKMAMDFEDSMAKVSTISDDTQVPIGKLGDEIKDLSNQTGISATEIANNVYDAISAGQSTGDAVNFVTNSTKLAKAGFAEAGQSLDLLTTILNSYGMESKEVGRVSDILINTQNLGKVTVAELSESMGKVIPTAKSVGVNLEQVSAGYAIMTSKGIKAAETTTYMNSMLNELGKSGTTASKTVIAASGGQTFQQLIASGKSLGDILAMMDDYAKKNNKSLSDMFGSAEAGKAALVLSSDAGKEFDKTLESMGNVAGATDDAFKKVNATTSQQFKIALNELKNVGIDLGSVLLPYLTKFASGLADVIKGFANLPAPVKSTIVTILGIVAAVGPVLMIFAKLIESVRTVTSVFSGIKTAASVFTALPGLITSPVGAVVGIIMLIAGAVYLIYSNWDSLKEYFGNFWTWVKNVFNQFWEWLKSFFSQWGPVILAIIAPFLGIPLLIWQHWDKIKEWLQPIFDWMCNAFDTVVSFFSNGLNGLKEAFNDFTSWASDVGKNICEGLVNGLVAGWDWVFEKVGWMADKIKSIFTSLLDIHSPSRVFRGYGKNIGEGLVLGIDDHDQTITGRFEGLGNKIKSLGNVKPNFNLSNAALSGVYNGSIGNFNNSGAKQYNFTPNITMHVSIADTGAKGTAQLTSELKSMAQTAVKNSMVEEFMADALRV